MFNLDTYLEEGRRDVDRVLEENLPASTTRPSVLHEAMRYSVFGGGKRIRPILCLASAAAAGGRRDAALQPGAAVEILHTYTLIHDDLPSMDNDDMRRGQPTCHIKFGEATAILAGDALLTLAFEWLGRCTPAPPYPPSDLVLELARAAGSQGVIGGQAEDLAAEGVVPTRDQLEYIHTHKTGALIRAAVRMGAIVAGAKAPNLEALTKFGEAIGHAFQIADDVLNATSDVKTLGKAVGTDAQRGKLTYVALYGLEEARRHSERYLNDAVSALDALPGPTQPLKSLAEYIVRRQH